MSGAILKSDIVAAAMQKVDRANYVIDKSDAYLDSPQSIGHGATISAPHMHGHAAEILLPYLRPGAHVLDVGSGSGYLSAVFHHLVSSEHKQGKVVGIDHIPELVDWSKNNLRADGLQGALDDGQIVLVAGDGRLGYPRKPLVDQLARPGRMFIPVGTHSQAVRQIDKDENGHVSDKELFGVLYVPLTDATKQRSDF